MTHAADTMVYVVRSDKHTNDIKCLSVSGAVNELGSVLPANLFPSRLDILAHLAQTRQMETKNFLYELTIGPTKEAL